MRTPPLKLAATLLALGLTSLAVRAQENADPYKKTDPKAADKPTAAAKVRPLPPPQPPLDPLIQVTCEWIELKTEDAIALWRDGLAPNSPELIRRIRDLEKDAKATLADSVTVATKSGQRSAGDTLRELDFPSDYNPVSEPNLHSLTVSSAEIKDHRLEIASEAHSTMQPTAFQPHPVGARLEIEPVFSPDTHAIDLNVIGELSKWTGVAGFGLVRMGGENVPAVQKPVFATSKINTSLTLRSGQTLLVNMSSAHTKDGDLDPSRRVLVLIHALAFPVE